MASKFDELRLKFLSAKKIIEDALNDLDKIRGAEEAAKTPLNATRQRRRRRIICDVDNEEDDNSTVFAAPGDFEVEICAVEDVAENGTPLNAVEAETTLLDAVEDQNGVEDEYDVIEESDVEDECDVKTFSFLGRDDDSPSVEGAFDVEEENARHGVRPLSVVIHELHVPRLHIGCEKQRELPLISLLEVEAVDLKRPHLDAFSEIVNDEVEIPHHRKGKKKFRIERGEFGFRLSEVGIPLPQPRRSRRIGQKRFDDIEAVDVKRPPLKSLSENVVDEFSH